MSRMILEHISLQKTADGSRRNGNGRIDGSGRTGSCGEMDDNRRTGSCGETDDNRKTGSCGKIDNNRRTGSRRIDGRRRTYGKVYRSGVVWLLLAALSLGGCGSFPGSAGEGGTEGTAAVESGRGSGTGAQAGNSQTDQTAAQAGNGTGQAAASGENGTDQAMPVLLDPVVEEDSFEAAAYRDLFDADVYTGCVLPETVEYSFSTGGVIFDHFEVMPGDQVQKGDVLACADTEALDRQIEEMEERIREMEEEQEKYVRETEEDLYEPEREALRLKDIVEAYEKAEPEKYVKEPEEDSENESGELPKEEDPGEKSGELSKEEVSEEKSGEIPEKESSGNGSGESPKEEAAVSGGDASSEKPAKGNTGNKTGGTGNGNEGNAGTGGTAGDKTGGTGNGTEENAGTASGENPSEPQVSEAYQRWETEYNRFNGQYRILDHQNQTRRLQMEQRRELYELEHTYLLNQLALLRDERSKYVVTSTINGEVVAMKLGPAVKTDPENPWAPEAPRSYIGVTDPVGQNEAVVAVGNPDHKLIKCDYLRASILETAQEYYAFIDGKRYEIEYCRTDSDRYSLFEFREKEVEADLGANAYIVVVTWSRQQVLTIPVGAINGEVGNRYVLLKQGDKTVTAAVTVGKEDGVYAEILSGLSEGDQVAVSSQTTPGTGRYVLEKGDPGTESQNMGVLFYPIITKVLNPDSPGTVYFGESQVVQNQWVQKGDVMASIRIQGDDIGLLEYENRLKRLQERLEDLVEQDEEGNQRTIAQQQETIEQLEEEIAQLKEDYSQDRILANGTGLVLEAPEYEEGDILRPGEVMAQIAEAPEDLFYLIIPFPDLGVRYGDQNVEVTYPGPDGQMHETQAQIVSLPAQYLGDSLASDYLLAALPQEAAKEIMEASTELQLTGFRDTMSVVLPLCPIKDVVLVPTSAVKVAGGQTYVYVVEENGDIVARSFVAAGSGFGYYWVADGLTEGMEICL